MATTTPNCIQHAGPFPHQHRANQTSTPLRFFTNPTLNDPNA